MDSLYLWILAVHSWIRWLLLLGSAGLGLASLVAWQRGRPWGGTYKQASIVMAVLASLQFLIGVALHSFFGSYLKALVHSPAVFFQVKELRFFGLEHPLLTIVAIALIHLGLARARRTGEEDGARAHKWIAVTQLAALLLLLFANPWWRPMLR